MAEIVKIMPNNTQFEPQSSFDELVISIANRIADATIEAIQQRDRDTWLTQQELMDKEKISWKEVKRMESYGLQSIKQGKYIKYCLADINEIKHLMKK